MVYSFQSTHPSRGATREQGGATGRHRISIHAPLAGCDHYEICHARKTWWISIHAPLAGCDAFFTGAVSRDGISIHAPLAGCDLCSRLMPFLNRYFNPRTPRGVRLQGRHKADGTNRFQSTHPSRGSTIGKRKKRKNWKNFNPRTPRGVRLVLCTTLRRQSLFQSTHPSRGST